MANCATLSGLTLDCRDNVGGIDTIYVADVTGSIVTGDVNASGSVAVGDVSFDGTSLTADLTAVAGLYAYECVKQTGTLTETGTFSEENGTIFFTSVASAVFNKLDAEKQAELYNLGVSSKLLVIVKDNNGRYWMPGNERGALVSNATSETGTAFGDRNGITIEFTGIDNQPMLVLTGITTG